MIADTTYAAVTDGLHPRHRYNFTAEAYLAPWHRCRR